VWKPIVLVEMKKRGEDLRKHYRQAFDYWVRLVPRRPRYVVLCCGFRSIVNARIGSS
jgi:hypothetical protein